MLAYSEVGTGPPILFLPGVTCSRDHWRPVADLISTGYRCVLIDPPGHGESPPGPMDVILQAGAIREVVDHLQLGAPILAGHSAGGIAATVYGILHPSKGVFSIEGTLDLTGPFAQDVYRYRELILDPDRFAEGFQKVVEAMRPDLIPDDRRDWALSLIGGTREVVLDGWRDLLAGRGEELNAQLRAALPSLNCPLLVVWGEEPPPGERAMVELAPQGAVEGWPGLGHFVHVVDPERTAKRLREFVQSIEVASIG